MHLYVVVAHPRAAPRSALARSVMEDMGWTVVGEASDGLEAVRLARGTSPDVLLVDGSLGALDVATGLGAGDPRTAPLLVRLIDRPQEHAAEGGISVLKGVPSEVLRARIVDALSERRSELGDG